MSRTRVYQLRLSSEEWEILQNYAKSKEISAAEVLRNCIKELPKGDS